MASTGQGARLFPGWRVVAAAFTVTFVGFGSAYTFSAFIAPLEREFQASRGSVSIVFALAAFLYFGLGAITGPMADRHGARRLATIGMLLIGGGLVLAGQARSLTTVYAAYGIGIGVGLGCAYVPSLAVVQRWFVRRRGLASGLAVSGIGVGTLVLPPFAGWLIATVGWRDAYRVLGVSAALVGIVAARWLLDDPARYGLTPDGSHARPGHGQETRPEPRAPAGQDSATERAAVAAVGMARPAGGLTLREAIRTARFAGLYVTSAVCAIGVFVPFVHLLPYAVDRGIGTSQATLLIGFIGIGSTAGRFLLGGIADRIGRDRFLVAMYLGIAATLALWAFLDSFTALAAFALLFGVFYGGWVAILPAAVADQFGTTHVAAIIGTLYTSVAFGTLIGPVAAGYAYDRFGAYGPPILLSAGAAAVAAVLAVLSMRTPLPRASGAAAGNEAL